MAVRVGLGPGVVASRGQAEDAEDGAQLQDLASTLDGAEQSRHGIPGKAPGIEPGARQPDESHEEADDGGQHEDAPTKLDDLELELGLPHAEQVQGDHVLRLGPQPPCGGRPRDADFRGHTNVARPLDQLPQAVVVDSLLVSSLAHDQASSRSPVLQSNLERHRHDMCHDPSGHRLSSVCRRRLLAGRGKFNRFRVGFCLCGWPRWGTVGMSAGPDRRPTGRRCPGVEA
jgi:hypothetical protein